MEINISARHGQLSEKTRDKIQSKVEKLSKLFERLTSIAVVVNLEHRDNPEVELQVSAEHKHDFVSKERAGELMASLDLALHKLEQQLRKYKEKVQNHHRSPGLREQQPVVPPETET